MLFSFGSQSWPGRPAFHAEVVPDLESLSPVDSGHDDLAAQIVAALERAIELDEWDAADHLLSALEALSRETADGPVRDNIYRTVANLISKG